MKWFKHDSYAHLDSKLVKLRMRYGLEGYGLYWYCLETIARAVDVDKLTFELEEDAEVIAHHTGISAGKVEEIMRFMVSLELFEDSHGTITCLKLAKRLDASMTSNPQMRKMIAMVRNHDSVMTQSGLSHDAVMMESEQIRLDQIRTNTPASGDADDPGLFPEFWDAYPKKVDRKKAQVAFNRLSKKNQQAAIADVKAGRYSDREKRYIPNATTYIHGERWNDSREESAPHIQATAYGAEL